MNVRMAFALSMGVWSSAATAQSAEKWQCNEPSAVEEWIISGNKMCLPGAEKCYRVIRNDNGKLVAFSRDFVVGDPKADPRKDVPALNSYKVIDKKTGAIMGIADALEVDRGLQPDEWQPPVLTFGHCTRKR